MEFSTILEYLTIKSKLKKVPTKDSDVDTLVKNYLNTSQEHKRKSTGIKFENIKKIYDNGITAVQDFNLTINPGEFVVLLGPSGCGKSTLLRMIAGIEDITDGHLKFNDIVMNKVQSKDRGISMVFQNYALYPFMTVEKNISFGLVNKTKKIPAYTNNKMEIKLAKNSNYTKIQEINSRIYKLNHVDNSLLDAKLKAQRELKIAKISKKITSEDQKELIRVENDIEKAVAENNLDKVKILKKKRADIQNSKIIEAEKVLDDAKKAILEAKNDASKKTEILKLKAEINKLKQSATKDKEKLSELYKKRNQIIFSWRAYIPKRVEHYTKLVNIFNYIKRKPADLSGGQRQRVALARAISKDSGLFLFDEPLSNLDAKLRGSMRGEIRKLHDSLKATSIYVTHDQIEAMSMADKVIVMNKGYIQQIAKPIDLITSPQNMFVAKFIGNTDINLFPAVYANKGVFNFKGSKAKVLVSMKPELNDPKFAKRNIILGIRPESIITDPTIIAESKSNVYEGIVENFELLGSEILAKVTVKGIGLINVVYDNLYKLERGAKVKIMINPNQVHIFDADTGFNVLKSENIENENAKNIWIGNNINRMNNTKLLIAQRLKLTKGGALRLKVASLFSKGAKERWEEYKSPIEVSDEKAAL